MLDTVREAGRGDRTRQARRLPCGGTAPNQVTSHVRKPLQVMTPAVKEANRQRDREIGREVTGRLL